MRWIRLISICRLTEADVKTFAWRHLLTTMLAAMLLALPPAARGQVEGASDGRHSLVYEVRLVKEAITPVTARFLRRAIRQAEDEQAECLVIVLDTPGGLMDSTSDIVKDILDSRTCVVVYVAPEGARAASAGGFILLSSHIAAMAPVTRVGAMHPVQIGGLPTLPQPERKTPTGDYQPKEDQPGESTASEEKIVNDTVAWARGLAAERGRNVEWAERAVRESIVAGENEALEQGVIDLLADDVDDLLRKIDGREVKLRDRTVTLQTGQGIVVRAIEMWWGERVLAAISNPNVAFLLLIFGFYGILFEFYSPGWGVAGTLGVICLVLAFFGLSVLPVNFVGLILIAVALALFAAEVFVTSYGSLAAGGIICLVMGGLMLVDSPQGFMRVSLSVIIPVAVATAAIVIFLIGSIVRAHEQSIRTGSEAMVGMIAAAIEDFAADGTKYSGTVRVHGELWNAACGSPVAKGQKVAIAETEGLTLFVEAPSMPTGPSSHGRSPSS
jgi:membrane-bound serine protease (ClpP class)